MNAIFLVPPPIGKKVPDRVAGCSYGFYNMPNIYALYPAAVLEKLGFEVSFKDFAIDGKNFSDFKKFVENNKANAYFLHSVNISMQTDLHALKLIRETRPESTVFFMGPAPTYFSEKFLKDEKTFVARGEPEKTIEAVGKKLRSKKSFFGERGISFLKNRKIVRNETRKPIKDLNKLPFPARHLLDKEKYFNPKLRKRPFTAMIASRGCSFQCIYCVPSSMTFARELEHKKYCKRKPFVGMRSAKNVIEELKKIASEGYKTLSFLDDQFVWGEKRTIEICNGIAKTGIEWGCQARADLLNEKILKAMEKSNCVYIDIGIESFNQNILDFIKKRVKAETLKNAIKLVKKHHIDCKINIMLGASPFESKQTIAETKKTIKELDVDQVMYNIATPFPGTEFYKIAKKNSWLKQKEYFPSDVAKESAIDLPKILGKELESEIKKANFEFFLNPKFVLRNIKKIGSAKDLIDSAKAVKKKLF